MVGSASPTTSNGSTATEAEPARTSAPGAVAFIPRCNASSSARSVAGRLVPIVGMLREQRVDDALQLRGMVRRQLPHRHMRLELDGRAERAPRHDVERTGAGGHLIEHGAKGKEIAPVVDRGVSANCSGDM